MRSARLQIALLALLGSLAALPASATAARFEHSGATPVARSAAARASSPLTATTLRGRIAKLMRGAGPKSGAWVGDLSSAGTVSRLYSRRAGKRRKLASNTKLFTTAAALVKFTPTGRLQTTAWNTGTLLAGELNGDLVLRGGGDPTLTGPGLATLASRVRAAGVLKVSGRLVYDTSFFDATPGVPQTGVRGSLGGTLSGLTYPGGAKKAARDFVAALRARGVTISGQVRQGELPRATSYQLAAFGSPTMAQLARDTNVPSNNFLAETLLKALGAQFGASGSTFEGAVVMKRFAAARRAPLAAENGSGLSVRDRAAPAAVGRLLLSMAREPAPTYQAWTDSLPVAGQSGTLVRRMRGSAAAGRCRAKTGTLNAVSALSGYCFANGHTATFSLLMSGISDARAHRIQDRITALVARYRP